ncbi:zinc finger rst2 [Fusarium sp. NRRL 25303]|nr:zinc finger rst2 [Fusarium sp. NRRL 25303]
MGGLENFPSATTPRTALATTASPVERMDADSIVAQPVPDLIAAAATEIILNPTSPPEQTIRRPSDVGSYASRIDASSVSSLPVDPDRWNGMILPTTPFPFELGSFDFDGERDILSSIMPSELDLLAHNSFYPLVPPSFAVSTTPMFTSSSNNASRAEFHSRAHSPTLDTDQIEPRVYKPSSVEFDSQLMFPDLAEIAPEEIDEEDFAHVDEISSEIADKVTLYAQHMDQHGLWPAFIEVKLPPTALLNSWVQLYFEHFHPIFPILHKPTFSSPDTHWLLIFTVAAIGAHFSAIKGSQLCHRAMHELIRRQSSSLCERHMKACRELWMCQVNLLNSVGLMYSGERRGLELAEVLQSVTPTLGRRNGLFVRRYTESKSSTSEMSPNQSWKTWLGEEERRRTGFGIWLLDSAFEVHFDLSASIRVDELLMPLPQPEDKWNSPSAQSWASLSSEADLRTDYTLEQVILENSWRTIWPKTGTVGKDVIIRYLGRVINSRTNNLALPSAQDSVKLKTEEALVSLLDLIEDDQQQMQIPELKAAVSHQVMISTALATYKSPTRNLASASLKFIYGQIDDQSWGNMATQWRKSGGQARLALFWAARTLHVIRSSRCTYFATPVYLIRAVLILWLYSMLACRFVVGFQAPAPAPSVVLGPKRLSFMGQLDWIENGWSQVKLPGIGLMKSLKCWGISASYAQLLVRLQASETSQPHNINTNKGDD